ncbi:DNA glycosylase AlkZ-like family protein [Cellulomonas sp. NPDC055163]
MARARTSSKDGTTTAGSDRRGAGGARAAAVSTGPGTSPESGAGTALPVSRAQVLRHRVRAQQLDRAVDTARRPDDADVLDLGVQDTGTGGAAWSLANRGVPVEADAARWPAELALAWTVRGAPHAYRRADLPGVEVALRPYSPADAAKRVYDASKPLHEAGIEVPDALAAVAQEMRRIVAEPTVKGVMSTRLTEAMPEPYLRYCRPCDATHLYEMPFRLAALHAGLELEPGTSPPVLRRVPGWPPDQVADLTPATFPGARGPGPEPVERLDVVRAYLHHLGPATPHDVASHLDAMLADVTAHWPRDVREVVVEGETRWVLEADADALLAADAGTGRATTVAGDPVVRLLGPFDLYLQARDRSLLVADPARQKDLWRTLGRPGAVLVDGEVLGTWRPKASGRRLTVIVDAWEPWSPAVQRAVEAEQERLAAHRGLTLVRAGA